MILRLERQPASADGMILGELFVDGHFACFALENDAVEIPVGRYPVTITKSQRFGIMLPLVRDVPGRAGIRIHGGKTIHDTEGCILVGEATNREGLEGGISARIALQGEIAHALASGEGVWLEVVQKPSGSPPLKA